MSFNNTRLVKDRAVAEMTSMSQSWVRQERFRRRKGLPHVLNIDPVMIGESPRYRIEDLEAFLVSLTASNDDGGPANG